MTKRSNEDRSPATAVRPSGPPGMPVIGNLLAARRDPLAFLLRLSRDYGDIARYRLGYYTGYLVNHPDYIRHVLQLNHRNYNKQNFTYRMLKPVLGEGLLTSDGAHWLRERRLIQPAFNHKRLETLGSLMTTASAELLDEWDSAAARGQPIDMAEEMRRLTLRIIGETLFSIDISTDTNTIGTAFTSLNQDVAYRFRTVFVPPLWVPTPRNLAFKRARAELNAVVYSIIAERRRHADSRGDLLDILLAARDEASGTGMTDQQVRDEVMTLMLAGHETTATALTWIWYLLSQYPEVAERLRSELDRVLGGRVPEVDDLPALPYTNQVVNEALRLYPPVWVISRTAIEDDHVGKYHVPAGTVLLLSQYTMHRHPAFWEQPERFRPERFSPEHAGKHHPYAYFPFGGGPRLCIGDHLAMMETQLVVATIAQRYRPELVTGHPVEPEPLVTLRPRYGMSMIIHPR